MQVNLLVRMRLLGRQGPGVHRQSAVGYTTQETAEDLEVGGKPSNHFCFIDSHPLHSLFLAAMEAGCCISCSSSLHILQTFDLEQVPGIRAINAFFRRPVKQLFGRVQTHFLMQDGEFEAQHSFKRIQHG